MPVIRRAARARSFQRSDPGHDHRRGLEHAHNQLCFFNYFETMRRRRFSWKLVFDADARKRSSKGLTPDRVSGQTPKPAASAGLV